LQKGGCRLTALLERLGISRPLLLDAAMGTALIERGLEPHAERAPTWSLVHPREVSAIHAAHVTAGAEPAGPGRGAALRRRLALGRPHAGRGGESGARARRRRRDLAGDRHRHGA